MFTDLAALFASALGCSGGSGEGGDGTGSDAGGGLGGTAPEAVYEIQPVPRVNGGTTGGDLVWQPDGE